MRSVTSKGETRRGLGDRLMRVAVEDETVDAERKGLVARPLQGRWRILILAVLRLGGE